MLQLIVQSCIFIFFWFCFSIFAIVINTLTSKIIYTLIFFVVSVAFIDFPFTFYEGQHLFVPEIKAVPAGHLVLVVCAFTILLLAISIQTKNTNCFKIVFFSTMILIPFNILIKRLCYLIYWWCHNTTIFLIILS